MPGDAAVVTEAMREAWKRLQQAGLATGMTFEVFVDRWRDHAAQHKERMGRYSARQRER